MVRFLLCCTLIGLLAGCSADENGSLPPLAVSYDAGDCSVTEQNRFVHDLMHDVYFWRDEVPLVDYAAYDSPAALLDALRYEALDPWSSVRPAAEDSAYYSDGSYLGLGYQLVQDGPAFRFAYVHSDSPVASAGIVRGDRLLAINGVDVDTIAAEDSWAAVIGDPEVGRSVILDTEHDGEALSLTIRMDRVVIDPVFAFGVHDTGTARVGYLGVKSFIETGYEQLDEAFALLEAGGATELVIDLRYNGGGLIDVARRLASLAGGELAADQVFARYVHNSLHSGWNETVFYDGYAGGFERVFVITGPATCSASELVANALAPFVDVVRIGDTTCGKPVGMHAWGFCDQVIRPVSFEILNADDNGGYYDGLSPDCIAADDLDTALGDPAEGAFAEALAYIDSGECSTAAQPGAKPTDRFRLPWRPEGFGVF